MSLVWGDLGKLLLAGLLGGLIGLEREAKHRPAGLRTNLFICLGAAMYTLLSDQLASQHTGDHTRIAAQIIPGIGFIGAGSIIARGDLITGITSAATIFVVASVGMAVGGGQYITAIFATGLILSALYLLGFIEGFLNLKVMLYSYEVTGPSAKEVENQVNALLEPTHGLMQNVRVAPTPRHVRLRFEFEGTRKLQARVLKMLRESGAFESVAALGPVQAE